MNIAALRWAKFVLNLAFSKYLIPASRLLRYNFGARALGGDLYTAFKRQDSRCLER